MGLFVCLCFLKMKMNTVLSLTWTDWRSAAAPATASPAWCRATGCGPVAVAATFWVWLRTTARSASRSRRAGSCHAAWSHNCRSVWPHSDSWAPTTRQTWQTIMLKMVLVSVCGLLIDNNRNVNVEPHFWSLIVGDGGAASEEFERQHEHHAARVGGGRSAAQTGVESLSASW